MMGSMKILPDPRLVDMRKSIDNLDIAFIRLLAERMRVVEKILFLKNKSCLSTDCNVICGLFYLTFSKHFYMKLS